MFCRARSCSFDSFDILRLGLLRFLGGRGHEGREHLHGLLKHLGVAADLVLDHLYRQLQVLAERSLAEGAVHLFAHLRLLFGEGAHGMFEEARNDHLHLIAVIGDELAQEGNRQQRISGF